MKYLETRKREAEKKGKEKQIVFFLFFCFFGAKNKSAWKNKLRHWIEAKRTPWNTPNN